jgi:hypothetical protein
MSGKDMLLKIVIYKKNQQKTKEKVRSKLERSEIRSELKRSARLPKKNNHS